MTVTNDDSRRDGRPIHGSPGSGHHIGRYCMSCHGRNRPATGGRVLHGQWRCAVCVELVNKTGVENGLN
jgi:hypothetical protein